MRKVIQGCSLLQDGRTAFTVAKGAPHASRNFNSPNCNAHNDEEVHNQICIRHKDLFIRIYHATSDTP